MIQPEFQEQINQFLDYYRNVALRSPRSCSMRKLTISDFANFTSCANVQSITNEVYNEWIRAKSERGLTMTSLNAYRQSILCLVKYFRDMGLIIPFRISLAPVFKDDPKKIRVYYTREDILRVAEQAPRDAEMMILLAFETGMRISELASLRLRNFSGKRVYYVGKGRKSHVAFLTDSIFLKLKKYIADFGISDCLWPNPVDSLPQNPATVSRIMKREFEKCGFHDFHPHALRHSFATDLQRQGASVEEISHMIGHSSVVTTERYLHGFDEKMMEKLFEKYHNYG